MDNLIQDFLIVSQKNNPTYIVYMQANLLNWV